MSIFDNVAYALAERPGRGGRRRRRTPAIERAVSDALHRAGLYDEVAGDLDRSALRLSGGQQQRLCIARALAAEPEVLLLDEPCSALDPISTATIEELIVSLRESVAIVIVTHNLQQAFRVADHVAFMHLGELVEYGTSEQVFDRPAHAAHARLHQRGLRVKRARARARRAGAHRMRDRTRNRAPSSNRRPSATRTKSASSRRWRSTRSTITRVSTKIKVTSAAVVHSSRRRRRGRDPAQLLARALRDVPIQITVDDAHGASVFTERQRRDLGDARVRPRSCRRTARSAGSTTRSHAVGGVPTSVVATVGEGTPASGATPQLRVQRRASDEEAGEAEGSVANHSRVEPAGTRRLRGRAQRRHDRRRRSSGAAECRRGDLHAFPGVLRRQPLRRPHRIQRAGDKRRLTQRRRPARAPHANRHARLSANAGAA